MTTRAESRGERVESQEIAPEKATTTKAKKILAESKRKSGDKKRDLKAKEKKVALSQKEKKIAPKSLKGQGAKSTY